MSERMRERAGRGPSFINQMVGEGRRQRNRYVVKDLIGNIIERNTDESGWVEIRGESAITHPYTTLSGYSPTSKAFSLRNVIVEGDMESPLEKNRVR